MGRCPLTGQAPSRRLVSFCFLFVTQDGADARLWLRPGGREAVSPVSARGVQAATFQEPVLVGEGMQSGEEQRSHTRGDMHVARCKCGSSSPLPAPSTQQTECPLLGPERSQAGAQHGEQRNGPVPTEQSGDGLGSFYPAGDARSHQARASCRPRRGRGGAQGRCPVAVSPEWRAERWLG